MLLQVADGSSSGSCPPQGFSVPNWSSLALDDKKNYQQFEANTSGTTVALGPASIILGHDDLDADDGKTSFSAQHEFGWDNEHPSRSVEVAPFIIEQRPITNGQYHGFWEKHLGSNLAEIPKSWVALSDGKIQVRTLYGPIPLEHAFYWPVIASYDELFKYACVQGGRLPTEPELRLFLDTFCQGALGAGNIGFHHWHPTSFVLHYLLDKVMLTRKRSNRSTVGSQSSTGLGHNGGVWEWTCTKLAEHEGFSSSLLYPGYAPHVPYS
jgi:formylglycine-generating enzyme required for sulfatase activity